MNSQITTARSIVAILVQRTRHARHRVRQHSAMPSLFPELNAKLDAELHEARNAVVAARNILRCGSLAL